MFPIFVPFLKRVRAIVAACAGSIALSATADAQLNVARTPDASMDYALATTIMRYYESAILAYGAVIEMQPTNDEAYSNRCWLQAVVGRELERALVDCNQVLRLNPNNVQVFDHRGLTNLKLGRYAQSIADYDRLLSFRPKQASSLYGRGIAKRKSGDVRGGDADIAAAKDIEPTIAEVFAEYGVR